MIDTRRKMPGISFPCGYVKGDNPDDHGEDKVSVALAEQER